MQQPDTVEIGVFIGVDVAKVDHCACAVTAAGETLLERPVRNDEAAIERLIGEAAAHGSVALVIDTTSSAASLLIRAQPRSCGCRWPTSPHLAMRRAADLYAGAAKTDPKDTSRARRPAPGATRTA